MSETNTETVTVAEGGDVIVVSADGSEATYLPGQQLTVTREQAAFLRAEEFVAPRPGQPPGYQVAVLAGPQISGAGDMEQPMEAERG